MDNLFPTAYFPSIAYMARLVATDEPRIELFETFHKQTLRNRCTVMTANGLQTLIVPVVKTDGNHTMTKDMGISYAEPWQQVHSRCLISAYKKSAYFDHYYPQMEFIFNKKFDTLIELNTTILNTLLKMLNQPKTIAFSTDYERETENDSRTILSDKHSTIGDNLPHYYQVFADKHGFVPNLSILDLLFNEGPESAAYLRKALNYFSF